MKELKSRIKKAGIKRKKLSKMIGVSYQYLNLWLNDFAAMPEEYEMKINKILNKVKQESK